FGKYWRCSGSIRTDARFGAQVCGAESPDCESHRNDSLGGDDVGSWGREREGRANSQGNCNRRETRKRADLRHDAAVRRVKGNFAGRGEYRADDGCDFGTVEIMLSRHSRQVGATELVVKH